MFTPETAREACEALCKEAASTRRANDARWSLSILYDAGKQWAWLADQSSNLVVQSLPSVMEPYADERVRMTMNLIRGYREKFVANTNPQRIAASPIGRHDVTSTYSRASARLMEEVVRRTHFLTRYRDTNFDRHVVGSAGIRLMMQQVGGSGRGGLRRFRADISTIMPWEILRDPGAKTLHPQLDEDRIGHEKPRSLNWMKQAYGWSPQDSEVDTTLGQLLGFQEELMAAKGHGNAMGPLLGDSKVKGVMVREFWLKDADKTAEIEQRTGIHVEWPWWFVGYTNPSNSRYALDAVWTVGDSGLVENPFPDLPLFFWHFDPSTEAMWADGLGWILMQGQDMHNSALSWWFEALNQCFPKWMYELGTVDKPNKLFNNNPRQPIAWKPKNRATPIKPERIAGVTAPQVAADTLALAPEWMQKQLNLADVQFGKGYKRDGSGEAYKTLIQEAETVVENRVTSDELELARCLYCLLCAEIKLCNVEQLRSEIGPDVPDSQVMELKRRDPRMVLSGVKVHPSTLRPKTRDQTEEHFVSLTERQVLMAPDAVLEILLQTGRALNTAMKGAIENQAAEIDKMMAGEDIEPEVTDHHVWHADSIRRFLDHPRTRDLPEEVRARLRMHWILHMRALIETNGLLGGQEQQEMQQPQPMGSPPAQAQGQPTQAGPGAAAPELSVA